MNNEVPFIVHESEVARLERVIKRLWIMCIIMFTAFVLSNASWVYYESQLEDIAIDQEVETETGNAYVSGIGDINGTSETDN